MADAECSQKVEKRSKKQQMAAEAIAMALMMQQNRGVNISEPPIGSQDTPRTNESMIKYIVFVSVLVFGRYGFGK